jgi:hypothetical protein
VGNVIGCQTSSCHLIQKWQESLKVMTVNNGDIGIFTQSFGRG